MGSGRLTGKQRAFVDHWFAEKFNGTKAARLAGYSGNDDNAFAAAASRLLRNAKVREAIEERWASHGMTAEEVKARLAAQARCDIGEFIGKGGVIDLEGAKERGLTPLLKSISWTTKGLRIETYSAQHALELIGKTMGVFVERQEHTGPGGGPVQHSVRFDVAELTDAEIDNLAGIAQRIHDDKT